MENNEHFKQVIKEATKLREGKYKLYGDCYRDFGLFGIAIKINDKTSRLRNITKKVYYNNEDYNQLLKDHRESLRDTAIDLINYTVMFIMELDEQNK
jgi:hypothetical protein